MGKNVKCFIAGCFIVCECFIVETVGFWLVK